MLSKHFQYGKEVLITGASSGIGLAATKLFSSNGYHVWALSRHRGPALENVSWLEADVTKPQQLSTVLEQIEILGMVIHCAGMGISGSCEFTPIEAARRQMDVNYFGVLNVNNIVLKKLRKQPKSLVIITTSVAGFVPIPYQGHYSSSKYALEAYGEALAMEAKPFGVRVCLVEPGDTKTAFTSSRTHDEPKGSPYYDTCTVAVKKMENDERNGNSPETVAKVFFKQANAPKAKVRVAVGFSYKVIAIFARLLPSRLRQFILGKLYS